MSENFFSIRNFEKFQHYTDRRPPWIKLYRDLWSDHRFHDLSVTHRYMLISLFVVASQHENRVPINEKWLRAQLMVNQPIPLQLFIDTGWIELVEHNASTTLAASTMLASRYPSRARGETETETDIQNTEKPPFIPPLRKSLKSVPETMPVTSEDLVWASKNHISVDLESETAAMMDWAHSKSVRRADWDATRRNWWREAQRRTKGKSNGHSVIENNKRAVDEFMRSVASKTGDRAKSQPH